MAFFQDPPRLGNQYDDDALLREFVARTLPGDALAAVEDEYRELGELAGGRWFVRQMEDRLNVPVLTQWDPWGHRIDHIELSPLWKEAQGVAAERGLVAAAYEGRQAEHSRVHQFVLNYLASPSFDVYSCPLAMTDGAARTLLDHGNARLIERAVTRLTSRDPRQMWTSGQWMTERTGGSDVGLSETEARAIAGDADGAYGLHGTKWFTSATTSEMALTLGRVEGAGPGGRGLTLFYVETRGADGRLNGIRINRLKDKLGTRKVPTAELTLDGARALPVAGLGNGIRNISSMLNVTRTWNAVASAWSMRRAVALVRDYAARRVQFGASLAEKPLHVDTLAGLQAEFEGAFHLSFLAATLLGRREQKAASERDELLLRVVTPLAKLTTGKQAVAVASEAVEGFGGAGYIEDTGLPMLVRDAQVLPIWEGTTNVLSLDVLRALGKEGDTFAALDAAMKERLGQARAAELQPCVEAGRRALRHVAAWAGEKLGGKDGVEAVEAGARRFALTLGRTLELALLVEHAQWCVDRGQEDGGRRAVAAARRFARHGVDLIDDGQDGVESRALAG